MQSNLKATAVLDRRQCAQDALYGALGFDYNEDYFVMGCNSEALWDFEGWAARTRCGSEPIEGTLLYHTAWTGPIDRYREEFGALLDSWLMTQNTARSEFHFWWMDRDPDPTDEFVKHYNDLGRGKIRFHRVDLHAIAKGTCLEGKSEYLNATVPPDWHEKRVMGPKEKADLTRILLLNFYGGIWLDTDDVLLRDVRPMLEFAGEFATKLTMSFYFNNNVLGIRRNSTLSRGLVDIVCQLPYSRDTRNYCKVVRDHCYPKWYWNNGVFQIAKRTRLGVVVYPMSFTDPAYGCFPPMLLAASGGSPMTGWTFDEVLDMIRGAFVLHTRGYNARKPLSKRSNFAKLYGLVREGAAKRIDEPIPVVKISPRTPDEQRRYNETYSRLRPIQVEPPFIPAPPWTLVQLENALTKKCLFAERSPGMYGRLMPAQAMGKCATSTVLSQLDETLSKVHERQTWQWHGHSGHVRPAIREPGRIYCLDAFAVIKNVRRNGPPGPPMVNVCHPERSSQVWRLRPADGGGELGGADTAPPVHWGKQVLLVASDGRCVGIANQSTSELQLTECASTELLQRWTLRHFEHTTHGFKAQPRL